MKGCKDENEHTTRLHRLLMTTGSHQCATVNHLKAKY